MGSKQTIAKYLHVRTFEGFSTMPDERADIERSRSHSKDSSGRRGCRGRRRVSELGRATVDNGAALSPDFANFFQLKACQD